MPIHANDIQTLHTYAQGVMNRAQHHGGNVEAVVLALLGGVIWRAQPGSIEIKQYDGNLANVVWWESFDGRRYVLSYNHEAQEIEMRDRTTQGAVLHSFSNATPITDIQRIFAAL